ncbi:hypothetical protein P153DRAFT_368761 [Dothidotthia symphoricarpi CBS 119687]|uniref:Antifungal protein n=1 Tax=Dothidotthia symphoricarpi CBS 119687 TaxID=1392245 RepID=A0A6A6A7R0_9PLEO|nr:uncharacterized protein P153DRAFT_368761 [Dothidotthia symphoricarpi CBS 119687]KAF2126691.1 hypothetical protein P153DRAFT_368761 [Dothidotthia symphoricarpi CBS 119687]
MSAVATPIDSKLNDIDTRGVFITYTGKCDASTQQCRYNGQNGVVTIAKCGIAANKKCTTLPTTGGTCEYDSASKVLTCH